MKKKDKKIKKHKYHTFKEDAQAIILPKPKETFKVSAAVILISLLFGIFFVIAGKGITLFLKQIF